MKTFIKKLKKTLPFTVQRIRGVVDSFAAYRYWNQELKGDLLYNINGALEGLRSRPASPTRTLEQRTEVARRIIDAYDCADRDQLSQRSVYRVSNEWVPIYEKTLKPLLAILRRRDPIGLRDLLDNFFRSSISLGLIGLPVDMEKVYFRSTPNQLDLKRYIIDSVYRYRQLQRLLPDIKPVDLYIPDIGNPYGIYVEENFIRNGADYQYFYAQEVSKLLQPIRNRRIAAELGGGIGGFGYYLNKIMPEKTSYINFDLPEILCISTYQLINLYPDKKILLYGEADCGSEQVIRAHDIALLPSFMIEKMSNDIVDVFFNSYSLAEMDRATIENYTSEISRITSSAILHVNHVSNSLVGADQFKFDQIKFDLKRRERALWNLGRNLKCDEYEFLYLRKS